MTETLQRWVEENKLIISESSQDGSDIISIEDVGKFLYIHPFDGNVIDRDFAFILSDEEFEILEEKQVDFILFEFGTKFYYSKPKQDKNNYNEIIYKPEFNDFKYLGKCAEEPIMDFVPLGIHDEYEMMNGSGACSLWVKKAKFLGLTALGVCDLNTLASSISFKTACSKSGLKSIIGETITVARNYDKTKEIQETFELKLYVLNDEGWENLLYISKLINVDYHGFIPADKLYSHGSGLALVIPKESEFNYIIDDYDEAVKLLKKYKKSFDKVFYQIDTVEYTADSLFKKHLSNIDKYIRNYRKKVKPITINDAYYLDREERDLKTILNKITGKAAPETADQFLKTAKETIESYADWLEDVEPLFEVIVDGIDNTVVLANCVSFKLDVSERKIPKFEVKDPEAKFFKELEKGIERKLIGKIPKKDMPKYIERIETECQLIVPNDLCSYFLILWDIMNFCKKNNIMVGPGRGSVCGSLVAYCLDITQIDPIPYALYFERFLNASRVSAHHTYKLKMADGSKLEFHDGDMVPLVGGKKIEASKDVDWKKLDIDVKAIVK